MLLRIISRWTRSADLVAASRRNFCAAVRAEGVSPAGVGGSDVLMPDLPPSRAEENALSSTRPGVTSLLQISSYLTRQNTRQMNCPGLIFAPAQNSLHMHQAARINGRNVLRSGHRDAVTFRFAHGHGDAFKLCGERPAKATTFVRSKHVHQLQAFDAAEQVLWFTAQLQLSQPVA